MGATHQPAILLDTGEICHIWPWALIDMQEKASYLREVEGLVKDYEVLQAEKQALEEQSAQQESLHTASRAEVEQAQRTAQQFQQVGCH